MQNTKHSIKTSLTALLLCFVMLVGTTFAWFTDEVTSANNIIKAGNLKIGMSWSVDNANWNEVEEDSDPIFNHTTWEPGYTEVRYVKVRNDGSLAFKYQMAINPNGPVDKLAEVIDVSYDVVTGNNAFVAPTANDKQGSLTKVGTLDQLIDENGIVAGGVLLPANELVENYYSGEIVVCISLHMDEYAGNEYQDKSIGTNFGINLYATQFDYENDSFDNSYDDDATWPYEMNFDTTVSIGGVQTRDNELVEELTIRFNDSIYAVLPAGVKLADGIDSLSFSGKTVENANNIIVEDADKTQSYDIHIEGIADDNQQPIKVYLGAILDKNISDTSLKLYHESTPMTRVNSVADFASNNQFTYDPATGNVVLYVDNFSVFSSIQTEADEWDGTLDISWYDVNKTEFTLTTAEQFAGFRDLVDKGNTFAGKTVKLGKDIDLNNKSFDPIGFGYWNESKVVDGTDTNTVFMGTFDGGNHTIYHLRQNCWELDTDKESYSTYTYSTAGAGLFASIKDATIKNLAVSGAEIVFECVDMGVVVGYAQGTCHFENIVVTDSKIANYNRYTGGVVGEVSYGPHGTDTNKGYSHTFKNVTVDSTVTVSGLWGSFGCGMGGVIGGKWGDATVHMENVVSAPVMDVYNDVVSAYQWYAFRGCGMLIGHTEEPYSDGRHSGTAEASFLTCNNVKVYYGDWVEYHYYEFENQDSDTGKSYPWVRAEAGNYCDAFSNIRYGVPTHDGVPVTASNADEYDTDKVTIVFDQLYGADRGMYGQAAHPGVTVNYKATKTIYFQNNWKWTDVKLVYWCVNGDDRWTTIDANGISIDGMKHTTDGTYDIYRIELPAYVAGFKFTGFDNTTNNRNETPEVSEESIIDGNIYWMWYDSVEKRNEMVANKYNGGDFDTHDIYLVGKALNDWAVSDDYRLTPSADGKTWTGTFTIDEPTEVKLYNKLIVNYNSRFIAEKGALNNSNTSLSPGKYKFTYFVENNNFTYEMTERKIYLEPTSDWDKDNARFAAYVWIDGQGDAWYDMTDSDKDGVYECYIPIKYSKIILCRMNGSKTTNNWDNKWNQTVDLSIPSDGKNLFTITNPWGNDSNGKKATGSWSTK